MINGSKKEEGVINLRADSAQEDEPEFVINRNLSSPAESLRPQEPSLSPNDKVKVKFDKFVTLVATRAYDEVLDKHADQDVIISTDLLADLASAHEDGGGNKWPLILLVGMLIGVAITWFVINK